MENIVLTIHLILAVFLIGAVLLQRSEGGALGIGGGGGGLVTSRGAATALSKVTWGLAIAFIITSLVLTALATRRTSDEAVLDRIGTETAPAETTTTAPTLPPADEATGTDAPLAPVAPAPAE
ncbi:MAG: preprotein translocase subunit SecG [Alphaproteobacteria bacterium]|nr:MAG: preprotein translocase subunit SecG [Alphaproteobacteria bacterium]